MALFEIIPGKLYQGGNLSPGDWPFLSTVGVNAVVDLEGNLAADLPRQSKFLYVYWPIEDKQEIPEEGLRLSLVELIDALLHRGYRVLVNCAAGINRSGFVNALVVQRHLGLGGEEAIAWVRRQRPEALNNPAFVDYLRAKKSR